MLNLTNSVWRKISNINYDVNRMPYRTDMEMYGELEHWSPEKAEAGDCDDYACQKRRRLREAFPEHTDAFRLATCWVEGEDGSKGGGEYHAVLIVQTDGGDYVLDNRFRKRVVPWTYPAYRWHKMEQPGKRNWVEIEE